MTTDMAVAIPLMPLLFMVMFDFLPAQWVPWRRVPKLLLGPYLLYAAFALWYLKEPLWAAALLLIMGFAISTWGIVQLRNRLSP